LRLGLRLRLGCVRPAAAASTSSSGTEKIVADVESVLNHSPSPTAVTTRRRP
jgi:hypothetical protein